MYVRGRCITKEAARFHGVVAPWLQGGILQYVVTGVCACACGGVGQTTLGQNA